MFKACMEADTQTHVYRRSAYTTCNYTHQHTVISQLFKSAATSWPTCLPHIQSHICIYLVSSDLYHDGCVSACVSVWLCVHKHSRECEQKMGHKLQRQVSLLATKVCYYIVFSLFLSSPAPPSCVHCNEHNHVIHNIRET